MKIYSYTIVSSLQFYGQFHFFRSLDFFFPMLINGIIEKNTSYNGFGHAQMFTLKSRKT